MRSDLYARARERSVMELMRNFLEETRVELVSIETKEAWAETSAVDKAVNRMTQCGTLQIPQDVFWLFVFIFF